MASCQHIRDTSHDLKAVFGYEFCVCCDHEMHSLQTEIGSSTSYQSVITKMLTQMNLIGCDNTDREKAPNSSMNDDKLSGMRMAQSRRKAVFDLQHVHAHGKAAFKHAKDDQHD